MKSFKTLTLGCKVNTYETQAIKELLEQDGFIESTDDNCDVFIINTCCVTQVGEQKSRQKIHGAHKKYPNAIIVVLGCYAQLHQEEVASIDGVSIILGTDNRSKVVELIHQVEKEKELINKVEKNTRNRTYECLSISSYTENTRAFLKIQDGCNNFCSYCIIPYTRGNFRSRPKEEILDEIRRLVDHGFKEIVLTGIDTASYGKDLENYNFDDLLEDILNYNPDLQRLRISSIEESELSDRFINLLKESKVIAHHLHMPLQSGSKTVLERMRRKYTKEQFKNTVDRIKKAIPDLALAADVIVGFPGETEEEFVETMEFIKECGFVMLHVFPYSIRPGTLAEKMPNQISKAVKKERVHRLMELSDNLFKDYQKQFIGKEVEVLFETYDNKTKINKGLTSNYLEVLYRSEDNLHNQMVKLIYNPDVK